MEYSPPHPWKALSEQHPWAELQTTHPWDAPAAPHPWAALPSRHPWEPVPPLEGQVVSLRPALPAPQPLPLLDALPPPGVVIGHSMTTGAPLRLLTKDLVGGGWIMGKNGYGKTVLIEVLAEADIREGRGCIVLDPAGDLTENLIARIPEHRINDVVLLDASDPDCLFGLNPVAARNPLDLDAISTQSGLVRDAFKKVTVGWGAAMNTIIRNAAHILLANPGTSLADMGDLLTKPDVRARLLAQVTHPPVLEWAARFEAMAKRQAAYIESTMTRVDEFLGETRPYAILSQGQSVDFPRWINGHRIVLVKLPPGPLSPDSLSLIGALLLQQVKDAARQQISSLQEWERPLVPLYVDEFPRFADAAFGEMFRELRKSGIVPVVAHQDVAQLAKGGVEDIPKAARHLFFFGITGDDIALALREFHPEQQKRTLPLSTNPLRDAPRRLQDQTVLRLVHELTESAQAAANAGFQADRYKYQYADSREWQGYRTQVENAANRYLVAAMQSGEPGVPFDVEFHAIRLFWGNAGRSRYLACLRELAVLLAKQRVFASSRDEQESEQEASRQLARRLTSFNVLECYCKVNQDGRVSEQYVKVQPLPKVNNQAPAVLLKRARIRQHMIDLGIIRRRGEGGSGAAARSWAGDPPPPPGPAEAVASEQAASAPPAAAVPRPTRPQAPPRMKGKVQP